MNRFVKDNLVLFIVLGVTVLGALVLLTFAIMGNAQMLEYHGEAKRLSSEINDLNNSQRPRPVVHNVKPLEQAAQFYKDRTAQLLPYFGQVKVAALDAFVKELKVDKQVFLETFRKAWEADELRNNPGGRRTFYDRFSTGKCPENNWCTDLKLSAAERDRRWQNAMNAFCAEYQKITVEKINETNRREILMSVLGVPRNFDGDPAACMNNFILPLIESMEDLCANPPMTEEEAAEFARLQKKAEESDDYIDLENKVGVMGPAATFGFDLKKTYKPEELADIAKNGEIIGDLVYRIAKSKVSSLDSFIVRENKFGGEKVGRYVIYHYTFGVTGDIAKIRRLVEDLNNAALEKRFYIVRSIFLYAKDDGAGNVMLARQKMAERMREEKLSAADSSQEPQGGGAGRSPAPAQMPEMSGMPGEDPGAGEQAARQVKSEEQRRQEEMAKPYDKRFGYGRMLWGGSKTCEAVFDVEYVYLAEPELE